MWQEAHRSVVRHQTLLCSLPALDTGCPWVNARPSPTPTPADTESDSWVWEFRALGGLCHRFGPS
jgi:hypothetical protein